MNLNLTLKKKWFDMILSGEKKEEYREIKWYWKKRLVNWSRLVPYTVYKDYETITFKNGYHKDAPTMVVEFKGINEGKAVPEWSDSWEDNVYVIKLGEIISTKNV